ncbi:MAG: aspartate aminotransferase family protein [Cyclobacteriaceae bacterium]|jgi:acetylornithine/N-succinyldiaminopimelate aminotransferase
MDSTQELENSYHFDLYRRIPVTLVKGKGIYVWDSKGDKYLDFLSGIAVNALGHSHPAVIKAIRNQAQKLIHTSNIYYTVPQARLAKLLCGLSGYERVFFCNSGLEANEAAIKLARKIGNIKGKKGSIVSFTGGFHGRSLASISMGSEKLQKGFGPLPEGFQKLPFNDLKAAKENINKDTIAVFVEAVQGEGGVIPADRNFITGLQQHCQEHDVLLIFDEIQTGFGRTGNLFGFMHYGVKPDIITVAKALGGGFPIGALLTTEEISKGFDYGDHGTTYGGNPLACNVAETVVTTIINKELIGNAQKLGTYMLDRLEKLSRKLPIINEVRGLGLMVGIELKVPCRPIMIKMLERGFLVNCTAEKTIRLLPPLIVRKREIDSLIKNLYRVLSREKI